MGRLGVDAEVHGPSSSLCAGPKRAHAQKTEPGTWIMRCTGSRIVDKFDCILSILHVYQRHCKELEHILEERKAL